jgi:3-oxoacyl-[acyl-carrier protein] reductase
MESHTWHRRGSDAVAPVIKRRRSGKIITASSVADLSSSANGGYAHYGAAKAV